MTYTDRLSLDLKLSKLETLGNNAALVQALVVCTHLAILLLLYSQTYFFDYVYFDDTDYILSNSAVRSGLTVDSIQWAFTSFYMNNWHPLTWLSHMLDVSLFGEDPGWAHIHNFLLHGVNSLLVYAILLKLAPSRWKACLLSLVFLVHPLHVESVAWIAERKDLLCAFFFLLGLLLYDAYRANPGKLRYAGVLATFALALMAKPMAVTFPVVLLILDFFVYREHFNSCPQESRGHKVDYFKAIVEKFPLLTLSALSSVVTILAQDTAVMQLKVHSTGSRWITATTAYLTYLRQFLLPVDLAAFYPLTANESSSLVDLLLPSFILIVLIALSTIFIPTFPLIAAGLCFYLITLLPVIGLVQVGEQAHADRYMYLPSIGILIACIYLVPSRTKRRFRLGSILSVIFIAYLSIISYWQVGYWQNRHTLFSHALDVTGPNYFAHVALARDYLQREMPGESRQHLLAAMTMEPLRPAAYEEMGNVALAQGEFKAAEYFYRGALAGDGNSAELQNNLGIALAEQGYRAEGVTAIERALQINPNLLSAQENLALYKTNTIQGTTP